MSKTYTISDLAKIQVLRNNPAWCRLFSAWTSAQWKKACCRPKTPALVWQTQLRVLLQSQSEYLLKVIGHGKSAREVNGNVVVDE